MGDGGTGGAGPIGPQQSVSQLWESALKSGGVVDREEVVAIIEAIKQRGVKPEDVSQADELLRNVLPRQVKAEAKCKAAEEAFEPNPLRRTLRAAADLYIELAGTVLIGPSNFLNAFGGAGFDRKTFDTKTFDSPEAKALGVAVDSLWTARHNAAAAKAIWTAIDTSLRTGK